MKGFSLFIRISISFPNKVTEPLTLLLTQISERGSPLKHLHEALHVYRHRQGWETLPLLTLKCTQCKRANTYSTLCHRKKKKATQNTNWLKKGKKDQASLKLKVGCQYRHIWSLSESPHAGLSLESYCLAALRFKLWKSSGISSHYGLSLSRVCGWTATILRAESILSQDFPKAGPQEMKMNGCLSDTVGIKTLKNLLPLL